MLHTCQPNSWNLQGFTPYNSYRDHPSGVSIGYFTLSTPRRTFQWVHNRFLQTYSFLSDRKHSRGRTLFSQPLKILRYPLQILGSLTGHRRLVRLPEHVSLADPQILEPARPSACREMKRAKATIINAIHLGFIGNCAESAKEDINHI